MSGDSGQAGTTGDVEDRLMAAVRDGDDTVYYSALRSARFFVPVHLAGGQSRLLTLDMDGQQHRAVFTSMDLASRAITQYTGGTAGWQAPDYSADELVKTFSEGDLRLLLNPGTPVQRAFTASELIERWRAAGHTVSLPRKRRGSIKTGLTLLVFAAVALFMWSNLSRSDVMCGSQVMAPDDMCVVTTNGDSTEQSFEETRSSQRRLSTGALIVGGVLGVAGVYMLVARIVTAVPRRE
jgi:SseB protein N-terminal domain